MIRKFCKSKDQQKHFTNKNYNKNCYKSNKLKPQPQLQPQTNPKRKLKHKNLENNNKKQVQLHKTDNKHQLLEFSLQKPKILQNNKIQTKMN